VLRIGDRRDWHFTNGTWIETEDGTITVAHDLRRQDGTGIQGHHYAFHLAASYTNARIRFEFQLANHSDLGIILRAQNETDFYVLHFPNCGQASRAQHFWVAFSKMDASGYLRRIKLKMVRRVPSNSGLWLPAEILMQGNRLAVRMGRHGLFATEFEGAEGQGGLLGLYGFMQRADAEVGIRNLVVDGEPHAVATWDETVRYPTIWFHPQPLAASYRLAPLSRWRIAA
jgi:hypothetical protein